MTRDELRTRVANAVALYGNMSIGLDAATDEVIGAVVDAACDVAHGIGDEYAESGMNADAIGAHHAAHAIRLKLRNAASVVEGGGDDDAG